MRLIDTYDQFFIDCDSTLSTIEGIDQLAELRGKKEEVESLTNQAMNGKVKFEQVYGHRLEIIQPTYADLVAVGQQYIATLVPGVKEFIAELLKAKKEVYIISGGYQLPIQALAQHLGIPTQNVHAVDLFFDNHGAYKGFDEHNPLTKTGGKRAIVSQLIAPDKRSMFIGDGMTDAETKGVVDTFTGFGYVVSREQVKKLADHYLKEDFFSLLAMQIPVIRT
jgi:phosphoserine phosphatase